MSSPNLLVAHPSTPSPGVEISAAARRAGPGLLDFEWSIEGAIGGLRLPEPGEPHAADDLWRHTCVEAFVRRAGESSYLELNLAPSRAFAVYGFRSYRTRDESAARTRTDPGAPTRIEVRRESARILLSARLDVAAVLGDPVAAVGPLEVGLSAVIETMDGRIAYFALRHPEGKPDFHHDRAFALRLEA